MIFLLSKLATDDDVTEKKKEKKKENCIQLLALSKFRGLKEKVFCLHLVFSVFVFCCFPLADKKNKKRRRNGEKRRKEEGEQIQREFVFFFCFLNVF